MLWKLIPICGNEHFSLWTIQFKYWTYMIEFYFDVYSIFANLVYIILCFPFALLSLFEAKRSHFSILIPSHDKYTQYLFALALCHLFSVGMYYYCVLVCLFALLCFLFCFAYYDSENRRFKLSTCGYIPSNASFQIFRSHVIGMDSIYDGKGAKQTQ